MKVLIPSVEQVTQVQDKRVQIPSLLLNKKKTEKSSFPKGAQVAPYFFFKKRLDKLKILAPAQKTAQTAPANFVQFANLTFLINFAII